MPYAHAFQVLASNLQSLISQGGYVVLFLFSLLEGIPLVGMVVPGHLAIIMAGFFVKTGTLEFWPVIIIGSAGAVLGDYLGFAIGRKYGMAFIDRLRPYFFIRDSHIEKARALLAKHTGKSMVIGRFSPVTRALMPFLVGTSETPVRKFWLFNIIGGVSWAVISIMVGYTFGAGYSYAAAYFGKFAVVGILATIVIIWGYRFVNIRFHVFKRYELFTLGLNVLSLWALAECVQDAWAKQSFMANFDIWVNGIMDNLYRSQPIFASIAAWVSTIGGTAVLSILGLIITFVLVYRKKWRSASIMFLSILSTAFMLGLMKEFFLRARPFDALQVITNDPSFPSGHAGMAAAFFVIVAYLLAPKIHSWIKREVMLVVCILAIIAVGLSRLVLNVHWASDVLAGWALGVFMATASILFVRYVGAILKKHSEN